MGTEKNSAQDHNWYDALAVFLGFVTAGFVFATFMLGRTIVYEPVQLYDAGWRYVLVAVLALVSLAYAGGMVWCHTLANRQRQNQQVIVAQPAIQAQPELTHMR